MRNVMAALWASSFYFGTPIEPFFRFMGQDPFFLPFSLGRFLGLRASIFPFCHSHWAVFSVCRPASSLPVILIGPFSLFAGQHLPFSPFSLGRFLCSQASILVASAFPGPKTTPGPAIFLCHIEMIMVKYI
jgi:hypothetical protein